MNMQKDQFIVPDAIFDSSRQGAINCCLYCNSLGFRYSLVSYYLFLLWELLANTPRPVTP